LIEFTRISANEIQKQSILMRVRILVNETLFKVCVISVFSTQIPKTGFGFISYTTWTQIQIQIQLQRKTTVVFTNETLWNL